MTVNAMSRRWRCLDGETEKISMHLQDKGRRASREVDGPISGAGLDSRTPYILEVTVICADHLPKTDMVGKCDPFVRLEYASQVYETQVVKSTYQPRFNETFMINLGRNITSLKITLWDWERLRAAEFIGGHTIRGEELEEIVRNNSLRVDIPMPPIQVRDDEGKVVVGKDGQPCEVEIKFCIRESHIDSRTPTSR